MENAEITTTAPSRPFRVLSLDGGGAKGVYTLGVLKEVEAAAKDKLCNVFDLVFGTSTGSIIAALIALGKSVSEIEELYFRLVPKIMTSRFASGRTKALKVEAEDLFGEMLFDEFKMPIGIVVTNLGLEKPMVFKFSGNQAHGRKESFKPGFGCRIADAVVASCAAYPFFKKVLVSTENQGDVLLMDGGYVANNPTLFAIADACNAFQKKESEIAVTSNSYLAKISNLDCTTLSFFSFYFS